MKNEQKFFQHPDWKVLENELNAGKDVTEADKKFVSKLLDKGYINMKDPMAYAYSGKEYKTTPLIASLCRFIYNMSDFYHKSRAERELKFNVQMFDRARYLVLKLDNQIYIDVID